jgi:hypothetical protein
MQKSEVDAIGFLDGGSYSFPDERLNSETVDAAISPRKENGKENCM